MQTVQLTERERKREHRVHSLCSGAVINANSVADREREHRVHSLCSGAVINANSAADRERERESTGYTRSTVEL